MNLFEQLTQLVAGKKDQGAEKRELLLAHVIEMTDRRIAKVPSYEEDLWPAIQFAKIYFSEVWDSVPGPFALDDKKFPLEALFPKPEDLTACLGRSTSTKKDLPLHIKRQQSRVCALLGMRPRPGQDEKIQLMDHTVRTLRQSPELVRGALLGAAFNSLLQGFTNQNLRLQQELEQLRIQQEMVEEDSSRPLEETDPALHLRKFRSDPKVVLTNLVNELYKPTTRLWLKHDDYDCLLLKIPGYDKEQRLPQMITQDRRHWAVCLVEFPIEMAEEALAKETHNHRFILI
ncbi:MAG: hypothetical protein LBQ75_04035 [Zoogloeaceae bacterium]|jgi:hypothetical protein|nr:hypothetical protein [Zoogloeaceae bacterium]